MFLGEEKYKHRWLKDKDLFLGPGKNFYWEETDRERGLGHLIDAFLLWARSELKTQDPKIIMSLALVFDELYMNALLHGYKENPSSFWVSIRVFLQKDGVVAVYRDRAVKFNPLLTFVRERNHHSLASGSSVEDMPIGGLGIHLISKFVDDISYNFVENCNEVVVTKRFH